MTDAEPTRSPSRDGYATASCPVCGKPFPPGRADQEYCSPTCRKTAWRRRRQQPATPVVVPPPGRPRRPITVYECDRCGTRTVGEQYCPDCATFMRRIGIGGACPHCDEPVAINDLIDEALMPRNG